MNEHTKKKVPIIVGPTGVGKTRLSLVIASQIKSEIISADSRQIYKFMDIGTAKPTRLERGLVRHHFIDIKYPDESYSSGMFGREARAKIDELLSQKITPIVVGGAGFYIRALVDGLMAPEIRDMKIRQKLHNQLKKYGLSRLYEKLQQVDPQAANNIHENDTQRILRALEVFEATGNPFSCFSDEKPEPPSFIPQFWGLTCERKQLYRQIENRVDDMIERGLIDEVKMLQAKDYSPELNALQTVGYKEVFDYLDGKIQYPNMIDLIKRNSRRYAKRQLTWFRADKRIRWIEVNATGAKLELFGKSVVQQL